MELLERAPLLEELGGVLAARAAGGRVVLVAGEAGIGKSTLIRWFTERQAGQARFLLGVCDPLLTPRALGPLHDIARQTGGRLAGLLASGDSREAVFAALLDELDQGRRPPVVVVVVEDAHWADEATLDLLVFLGRRMERTRALLLVTYRDDELTADHRLRAAVGLLAPGWCATCGWSRCRRRRWPSWRGRRAARRRGCARSPAGTRCWSPRCWPPPATRACP